VLLDAEEAIELAVPCLAGTCYLLFQALLDFEVVKSPAADSEAALALAV